MSDNYDKYNKCKKNNTDKAKRSIVPADIQPILFTFAVKKKKWAIIKLFDFASSKLSFDDYLKDFFDFDISIKNGNINILRNSGWEIVKI